MFDALDVCPRFDDNINRDRNGIFNNFDIWATNRVISYLNFENEVIIYSNV